MALHLHTFLILIWILPYVVIKITGKEKILGLSKKFSFILAIASVVFFILDLLSHLFISK
jgi:uncharacterized membrane protein